MQESIFMDAKVHFFLGIMRLPSLKYISDYYFFIVIFLYIRGKLYTSFPVVRNVCFLVFLSIIQGLYAEEYVLNASALHVDAREFSMGGLVGTFEPFSDNDLEITYLMPYLLKELSVRKLEFNKTLFDLEWTLGWCQSGNADWMENVLSMHLGKKLSEYVHLGVEVNLLAIDNAVDEPTSVCFAELDCHYSLNDKTTIGLTLINPGGTRIKSINDWIPLSSSIYLGACLSPAKKCQLYGEFEVRLNNPIRLCMGIEYLLNDFLILRTGFSTGPLMPSWGIGGRLKRFHYSWGGNLHPILGISNGFTLNYNW
jgi:hypothetical protein